MDSSKTLYEVLGVDKGASAAEIKRAYYALALKLHPDKNPDDEEASAKFQSLQKIYAILSDEDNRKIYDQTGRTDDETLSQSDMSDLYSFFAGARVSTDDIDTFAAKYRGSAEEMADVLTHYTRFRGNMETAFLWIILSDPEYDSHRFMDIIQEAIEQGKAKRFKVFTDWARRVAATPRPADPLKERGDSGTQREGPGSSDALVEAIKAKRATRADAFIAELEKKYGGGGGGKGKGKKKGDTKFTEPSEEVFAAAAARWQARKGEGDKSTGVAQGRATRGNKRKADEEEEDVPSNSEEEKEDEDEDVGSSGSEEEEEASKKKTVKRPTAPGRGKAAKGARKGAAKENRGSAANAPASKGPTGGAKKPAAKGTSRAGSAKKQRGS